MNEKRWQNYELTVNGLPQHIRYNADTVEGLFLPLLRRLTELPVYDRRIHDVVPDALIAHAGRADEVWQMAADGDFVRA